MHWQNIPSPKATVCGGQIMQLCYCKKKKGPTKEITNILFLLFPFCYLTQFVKLKIFFNKLQSDDFTWFSLNVENKKRHDLLRYY